MFARAKASPKIPLPIMALLRLKTDMPKEVVPGIWIKRQTFTLSEIVPKSVHHTKAWKALLETNTNEIQEILPSWSGYFFSGFPETIHRTWGISWWIQIAAFDTMLHELNTPVPIYVVKKISKLIIMILTYSSHFFFSKWLFVRLLLLSRSEINLL